MQLKLTSPAADDDFTIVETCTDPCGPNKVQREQVLQLMMPLLCTYFYFYCEGWDT